MPYATAFEKVKRDRSASGYFRSELPWALAFWLTAIFAPRHRHDRVCTSAKNVTWPAVLLFPAGPGRYPEYYGVLLRDRFYSPSFPE